jgi:hypothetical protein
MPVRRGFAKMRPLGMPQGAGGLASAGINNRKPAYKMTGKYGGEAMTVLSGTPWLKRLAAAGLAGLVSIGALTMPTAPANARVFVGFGIGAPVGWAYVPPPYPVYYPYPYYYYAYPRYYAYPGFFIGATFGPHHHWRHWHHHWW